jgi:inward rectifier potassium channel
MANQFNDFGLGTKVKRLVNVDGTFNVKRVGLRPSTVNLYQDLVKMSWIKFLTLMTLALFLINGFFALVYYYVGVEHFAGMEAGDESDHFLQSFFFSFQTFTTVGYGHIAPRGYIISLIASLEAMAGLMVFAIITGLLYGRFSKPNAKILFSQNILITPMDGNSRSLVFRIVNLRKCNVMDVSARVIYSYQEKGKGRSYFPLELERSEVTLFPLNWNIVHPINEESPLFEKTSDDLFKNDGEFIVVIKGFDDTFGQEIHSVHSYRVDEIVWNARFNLMYETGEDHSVVLDFGKLNSYTKA